jgi:magnesium chelatase family protein
LNKISGPLLDRIDLHVEVTPVSYQELSDHKIVSEKSVEIRKRVQLAREIQYRRFEKHENMHCNAQMSGKMVREVCRLDPTGSALIKTAMEKLQLSARAYDRILKVARTTADMEGSERILTEHLAQAIQYRQLDREGWLG